MTYAKDNTGLWYDVFLSRARTGKTFLKTKETPDNRLDLVDMSTLDMSSYTFCVAAQFCGREYAYAYRELGLAHMDYSRDKDLGFVVGSDVINKIMQETGWGMPKANDWAYGLLTLAWKEVLAQ